MSSRIIIFFLIFILFFSSIASATNFNSTWNTSAISDGSTNSTSIKLPLAELGTFNFTVDWGDETTDTITTWNQANVTHTYASEGIYNISISGTIIGFRFYNYGDKLKLLDISNWGVLNLGQTYTESRYFYGCSNFNASATDTLNLTGTTSFYEAFRNSAFNGKVDTWDTNSIITMYGMFHGDTTFNQNISMWNMTNVLATVTMFHDATSFNQDLGSLDMSNVNYADGMFYGATSFNQNISMWNISNMTTMYGFLDGATSFDHNLGGLNISTVTDMELFLNGATLSPTNYTATLNAWASLPLKYGVLFSGGNSQYTSAGVSARNDTLIGTYGWTITDGGIIQPKSITWLTNSSIINGLGAIPLYSAPTVFEMDNLFHLISGAANGNLYTYTSDGSTWSTNSTTQCGLNDVGSSSIPSGFTFGGLHHLLIGSSTTITGKTWNGTCWADNASISSGLSSGKSISVVFKDGLLHSLVGVGGDDYGGYLRGYSYNGTSWVRNSSVANGLESIYQYGWWYPNTFYKDSTWQIISGNAYGTFNGYTWHAKEWLSNSNLVEGLNDIGWGSTPAVFQKNDLWYLISGGDTRTFGFIENTAPTLTGITLSSGSRKYNKNILVNTTANITDNESSSALFTTYYYNGSNKVFLGNSSWFILPANASANIAIPWNDGAAHTIYAQVIDNGDGANYNKTSTEVSTTFTSDINPPFFINDSLSTTTITQGSSVTLYTHFDCNQTSGYDDCVISSVKVKVLRPDASYGVGDDGLGNWTMTNSNGTLWYKTYTATTNVGDYLINDYFFEDESGISGQNSSNLSFTVSEPLTGGGGGGGGGGGTVIINPPATPLTPSFNLSLIGITDGARNLSDISAINKCLTESLFLSNECSNAVTTTLKNTANWWTILGVPFASIFTIFLLNLVYPKKRSYLDAVIYSLLIIIFLLAMNLMGFNIFIWNYIYNNSLSAFTFFSFATFGVIGTLLLDEFVFTRPFGGWNKWGRKLQL